MFILFLILYLGSGKISLTKKRLDLLVKGSYHGHTNKAKEISMEKFTNRSIQNNELDQEQFSLQDRIQNIHNFENEDTTRDQEIAIVASVIR